LPSYINIEAVLSWPVFDDQDFESRLDLRALLQSNSNNVSPTAMSVAADFEISQAGELLQNFLENVHIYNPVLEEAKVRDYIRYASFNGLGWDAQSCLLVRSQRSFPKDHY
jgi:hypothetical protein